MTSRLETVRRVAELREAGARAAVAAATAARSAAEQHHAERLTALAGLRLTGGSSALLRSEMDGAARLGASMTEARQSADAREQERSAAVAGWVDATRRAQLLTEVCARHREQRAAGAELADQHLLDDLAARRTRRST